MVSAPVDLDLDDEMDGDIVTRSSISSTPYNRDEHQDKARKYIAYTLLGTLIGVIILSYICLMWALQSGQASSKDNFAHIIGLLNIIFGPVITLVGSATGFYFGSQMQAAKP